MRERSRHRRAVAEDFRERGADHEEARPSLFLLPGRALAASLQTRLRARLQRLPGREVSIPQSHLPQVHELIRLANPAPRAFAQGMSLFSCTIDSARSNSNAGCTCFCGNLLSSSSLVNS